MYAPEKVQKWSKNAFEKDECHLEKTNGIENRIIGQFFTKIYELIKKDRCVTEDDISATSRFNHGTNIMDQLNWFPYEGLIKSRSALQTASRGFSKAWYCATSVTKG